MWAAPDVLAVWGCRDRQTPAEGGRRRRQREAAVVGGESAGSNAGPGSPGPVRTVRVGGRRKDGRGQWRPGELHEMGRMDPLCQRVRSSVNDRWTLTLAKPVDHVFFLTLSNPVECDPALLFLPTTVLFLFSQKKSHDMPPTLSCAHSACFSHELVWSGCRVATRCHLVRYGGATARPGGT